MNIAFCYESVLPARGGCETYISDLARRLVADGHDVHLYASRRDAAALPAALHFHELPSPRGPRFLRPWRFAAACERALRDADHHVTIGFDKTWGQDVLYPQGGLHAASAEHNVRKHPRWLQPFASLLKALDPAHHSFQMLERRQYLSFPRPLIVVNSEMVRGHFGQYYGIDAEDVRVVRAAVDPDRFCEEDRPRRRIEWRERWGLRPDETVAVFIAMNYRLKGLAPLLHALCHVPTTRPFRLLVAGNPRYTGYEALAQRLGVADRVRFVGYCPEPRNAYFASDFLVHPTFYDPCSLVVLEALACGLPVITSRYNGASELLTPSEGFVIDDPHDDRQLGWCLTLLLDPARRQTCAAAARRAAMQWTFEHHYRQMLQVFAEAAARRAAA